MMTKSNEDLVREITELKNEMKRMKEALNMLFSLVVESDEEDDEDIGYPGIVQETPRFNT